MTASLNHNQHRAAQRQSGGGSLGFIAAPATAGRLGLGGGFAPILNFTHCSRSPSTGEHRRGRFVLPTTPRPRPVLLFLQRGVIGRTYLLSQAADHLPCRDTDLPPIAHLEPHSSIARYVPTRSERGVENVRVPIGEIRNV